MLRHGSFSPLQSQRKRHPPACGSSRPSPHRELGFDGQTVFLSKIQPDPLIDVPHPDPEPASGLHMRLIREQPSTCSFVIPESVVGNSSYKDPPRPGTPGSGSPHHRPINPFRDRPHSPRAAGGISFTLASSMTSLIRLDLISKTVPLNRMCWIIR